MFLTSLTLAVVNMGGPHGSTRHEVTRTMKAIQRRRPKSAIVHALRRIEAFSKEKKQAGHAETHFGTWEHMLLPPEKHFEIYKKKSNKIFSAYVSSTSSFAKPTF
jgi:hypothetical protein